MIDGFNFSSGTHTLLIRANEPVLVNVNPVKIATVISNLLNNAVNYSAPGSSIELCCERDGAFAKISVKDEGKDHLSADLEKLFDQSPPFHESDIKTSCRFGIALYLCAEIIRQHGGKMNVKTESGKGAAFCFQLPIA